MYIAETQNTCSRLEYIYVCVCRSIEREIPESWYMLEGKGIPGDVSERSYWLQQCAVRASAAAARPQPVCLAEQTHDI
jgi:hypothetical protein